MADKAKRNDGADPVVIDDLVTRLRTLAGQVSSGSILTDAQYRAVHTAHSHLGEALRHAGRPGREEE